MPLEAPIRRSRPLRRPALALCAVSAVSALLVGCKVDNRPFLARNAAPAGPVDAAYAYAPGPLELPYAEPAQVRPAPSLYDGYSLAERAYAYDRAAWRAPPDYGFSYGGIQPWVWRTSADDLMFAEPIDDGYRFYYYEPGEPYPYFVRDPSYGYAYSNGGALTAVLTAAGALLANDQLYRQADVAGRYLARGYDLREAYYAEPRFSVTTPVWEARAPRLAASRAAWSAAADRQPAWRYVRQRDEGRDLRHFAPPRVAEALPPRREEPRFEDHRRFADRGRDANRPAFRAAREQAIAQNALQHQAPVVARETIREQRRDAREAERQAFDAARVQRDQARDAARGRHQQQQANAIHAQRAEARVEAPHFNAGGGGRHEAHAPQPQAAPAPNPAPQAKAGGGDHGNHGGGDDHGRGHKDK